MARKKKQSEPVMIAEVVVTRKYFDTIFRSVLEIGEGFECSQKRAKELTEAKVAEIVCLKNSL